MGRRMDYIFDGDTDCSSVLSESYARAISLWDDHAGSDRDMQVRFWDQDKIAQADPSAASWLAYCQHCALALRAFVGRLWRAFN